jgi:hypothetical protein
MTLSKQRRSKTSRNGFSTVVSAVSIELITLIAFLTLLSAIRKSNLHASGPVSQPGAALHSRDFQWIQPTTEPPIDYIRDLDSPKG